MTPCDLSPFHPTGARRWCTTHKTWSRPEASVCGEADDIADDARERAIRAVVGAQWAVACALFCVPRWTVSTPFIVKHPTEYEHAWRADVTRVAVLPCAVDLVGDA